MGVITIEIPQEVNKKYRIVSENSAKEILSKLENIIKKESEIDDDDILGLWSDGKDSTKEIAKNLRPESNE